MVFGSSYIVNMKANKLLRIHHMVMVFALACLSVLYPMTSMAQNKPASKILILGDSLSAEYGLARGTGWVALLEKRLKQQTRLGPLLKSQQPQIVLIELGANDGLRGLQLSNTEKNLKQMIQQSQISGAQVLLLGMRIPPNYGVEYTQRFFDIYARLAQSEKIVFEMEDNFQKQTNRNRMYIYSPNGLQLLNIPIKHSKNAHQKTNHTPTPPYKLLFQCASIGL